MASVPRVLAFAGSTRTDSWNKKLVRVAADAARAAGAETTLVDLRDFALPLYDGDLEANEGLPAGARSLKALFLANDALLISSPEYNSSVSGALKNAIDWVSRAAPGEAPLACFANKVAGLVAASPGALGGLRGLVHLRAILGNIRVLVIPEQVAVSKADAAFAPDGSLVDPRVRASVEGVATALVRVTARLHA